MDCRMHICSVIFTIFSDDVHEFFKPMIGIHQGQCLAPCLLPMYRCLLGPFETHFLEEDVGLELKYPKREKKIQCLLFTDSSLFSCRSNLESCKEHNTVLYKFC